MRYAAIKTSEVGQGDRISIAERDDEGLFVDFVVLRGSTWATRGKARRIARALNALDIADRQKARKARDRKADA